MTPHERRQAATWCAFRGPEWSAEVIRTGDGRVSLGLVTPRSKGAASGSPRPTWIIKKLARGLVLIDAATCTAVGVFTSISDALAEVARTEDAEAANDNEAA